MTKSERIRKHYEDGFLTVAEIADLVGCDPAYVRVVARQRAGGQSVHDKRYREANIVDIREMARKRNYKQYHSDPEFRARHIAMVKRSRRKKKAKFLEAAE